MEKEETLSDKVQYMKNKNDTYTYSEHGYDNELSLIPTSDIKDFIRDILDHIEWNKFTKVEEVHSYIKRKAGDELI